MKKQLDLDIITSYTLKTGVIISISLILVGVILLFVRNGGMGYSLSQLSSFNSGTLSSAGISLGGIPQGIFSLDGIYFVTLGLWILIFTPISVVFIAMVDFLREKNRLYVVMSLLVLFNLFFAMIVIPRLVL